MSRGRGFSASRGPMEASAGRGRAHGSATRAYGASAVAAGGLSGWSPLAGPQFAGLRGAVERGARCPQFAGLRGAVERGARCVFVLQKPLAGGLPPRTPARQRAPQGRRRTTSGSRAGARTSTEADCRTRSGANARPCRPLRLGLPTISQRFLKRACNPASRGEIRPHDPPPAVEAGSRSGFGAWRRRLRAGGPRRNGGRGHGRGRAREGRRTWPC